MLRPKQAVILILTAASAAGALTGERLQTPDSTITIPNVRGKKVGKFANGFLVTSDAGGSGLARVYVYNRTGAQAMRVLMGIPGAVRVDVNDFAVSPSGLVAVAGTAYGSDGAYSGYIAWIGADGTIQRVVRTSPFGPWRLIFANDGTLWAAGSVQTPDRNEDSAYDILRRYDVQGELIGSSLSRSSFPMNKSSHRPPALNSFMAALSGGIAFYTPSQREWVQASSSGVITLQTAAMDLGAWGPAEDLGSIRATGVAALTSGRIYVSAAARDSSGHDQPLFYRVDPSTMNWQTVDASAVLSPGHFGSLAGADGDRLVIQNGAGQVWWAGVE